MGDSEKNVLIVAKCIVNSRNVLEFLNKYVVLIVAKCIVNVKCLPSVQKNKQVLIVAKCIVNLNQLEVQLQKY